MIVFPTRIMYCGRLLFVSALIVLGLCSQFKDTAAESGEKLKTFCYFTNWSNKLINVETRYDIADTNTTLCTHLIYAFAKIDTTSLRLTKTQRDDDNGSLFNKQGRYFDFNKLKLDAPHLRTLLSVGGANANSGGFIQIVQSEENMRVFSRNVAIYLRDRDFDGIDIDWEWPEDVFRDKFTQLLSVMREVFRNESMEKSKPELLITIGVAVGYKTIHDSYNIPEISRHVDYIKVMAYDFHGPWSHVTSFSAPLYSRTSDIRFNQNLSQAWAIDEWINNGAPPSKLVMGLQGAATTFLLKNMSQSWVGAPATAGPRGPYLQSEGHVPYYRTCEMLMLGASERWDDEQKMAYGLYNDLWFGYGSPQSMKEKVKFMYSRKIAGAMFWSLEFDDFSGRFCNRGRYPLLTAVYNSIEDGAPGKSHNHGGVSVTPYQGANGPLYTSSKSTPSQPFTSPGYQTQQPLISQIPAAPQPSSTNFNFQQFMIEKLEAMDHRFNKQDAIKNQIYNPVYIYIEKPIVLISDIPHK